MVNDWLQAGRISVAAEPSEDRWFGITYREDRDAVARELEMLHQSGVYPVRLF
jgi:hypothetical protein